MIHPFPKCPAICTANNPCAYVPYSLLVLPCTQCVAIEDVDESLKDIINPPTKNPDLSRKVPIFLIQNSGSLLNIVPFECQSCSETHSFKGCDQNKLLETTSEDPGTSVRSVTPTGSKEGSSEIPDSSPLDPLKPLTGFRTNLSLILLSLLIYFGVQSCPYVRNVPRPIGIRNVLTPVLPKLFLNIPAI
jgi:hypothetical protein